MNLITTIAGWFGGSKLAVWLLLGGTALAAAGGLYAFVDHQGYRRAELEWTVKYDKRELELNQLRFREIDRQASANAEAKAREAERIAEMEREAEALEARIAEFERAADADPNKDRIGLGADSVKRLNGIR